MAESKTSPRRLSAAQRTAEAINLRLAGASYATIARELKYADKATAFNAVKRAMDRTVTEPAEELRDLEADRLDALQLSLWADATDQAGTPETRAAAVRAIVLVMQRRARLLGLDQPAEMRLQLEREQGEFMEAALRRVIEGIQVALVAAGLEQAVAEVWPTILGEVVPRELSAVAEATAQ